MRSTLKKGFTLLEILLVVAAIAILAGIVILALNPSKQLGDTRNAQRRVDINTISNAMYQYSIDNNGIFPTSVTTTSAEICRTGGTCTGLADLSVLTTNQKYLVSIPMDPSGSSNANGTGYTIVRTSSGRITVTAPLGENVSSTISVTR